MPVATPKFKVAIAPPTDPRFQGLFDELEGKLEITVPDGFLTGGIVTSLPGQNIGSVLYQSDWWIWDEATSRYQVLDGDKHIGEVAFFSYAQVDATKWLVCDGRTISRSAPYDQLFSKIGTKFGIGDGSTSFNLPDARGRSLIGTGAGQAPNGNNPPINLTPRVLGDLTGEESHAIVAAELPALDTSATAKAVGTGTDKGYSTTAGTPITNMQPSLALLCCIRYA